MILISVGTILRATRVTFNNSDNYLRGNVIFMIDFLFFGKSMLINVLIRMIAKNIVQYQCASQNSCTFLKAVYIYIYEITQFSFSSIYFKSLLN